MRYAVLSDIHGNLEALNSVMEHLALERIDRYFCLGDVVGYGANPSECLNRLIEIKALIVAGNHDYACLGKLQISWFNNSAREAVIWTRGQLGFSELDNLRKLPLTATEGAFTLVHGSLKRPQRFEYIHDAAQAIDSIRVCKTQVCLVGHTHVPVLFEYDKQKRLITRVMTRSEELKEVSVLLKGSAFGYVINPGSVGQPRDGDPRASYAVFDTEHNLLRICRAEYDISTAQEKIRETGLPSFLADRLAIGR